MWASRTARDAGRLPVDAVRQGEVFPVCSATTCVASPLTNVEQLRHETLLSIDDDRPGLMGWPLWFAE
jgi:hypothetical protein